MDVNIRLKHKLKGLIGPSTTNWKWRFDTNVERLYEETDEGWLEYRKTSTGRRTLRSHKYISTGEYVLQKPSDSEIASVYRSGDYYKRKSLSTEDTRYNTHNRNGLQRSYRTIG